MNQNITPTIFYKDNSIYKLIAFQPYMRSISQYIIHFEKYSFYHYARRTTGDKYSYTISKHVFTVDLSYIEQTVRDEFINKNWGNFIYQLSDFNSYTNKTILNDGQKETIFSVHPQDHNGEYQLNTMYTLKAADEFTFPSLFYVYGAMLLVLDVSPNNLYLTVSSGYDSRNANETQYYNVHSFRNDFANMSKHNLVV